MNYRMRMGRSQALRAGQATYLAQPPYLGQSAAAEGPYQVELAYDANVNVEYVGRALGGKATNESAWQIQKLEYDGSNNFTGVKWADGNRSFDNVWDDRVSLSYL
jgi:YD repeat-containing protein